MSSELCKCGHVAEKHCTRESDEGEMPNAGACLECFCQYWTGVESESELRRAMVKILNEVKTRRWICEGRGPYTYDDDRYRAETGFALDAIEEIARKALEAH